MIPLGEVVELVGSVHEQHMHSGVNKTHRIIAANYYGVSRSMVEVVLSHCGYDKCKRRYNNNN